LMLGGGDRRRVRASEGHETGPTSNFALWGIWWKRNKKSDVRSGKSFRKILFLRQGRRMQVRGAKITKGHNLKLLTETKQGAKRNCEYQGQRQKREYTSEGSIWG